MSEPASPPPTDVPPAPVPPRAATSSSRRVIAALVAVLAAAGLGVFVVAVLPRWWAHRVGDAADGRFSTAIWLGLSAGLLATALPLAAFARALGPRREDGEPADGPDGGATGGRRRWAGRSLRRRAALLVVGLVLAAPNLLTLGIEVGNGSAAHAADRTLDVQAPGFRGATAVGAALAVAAMLALAFLMRSRRRRGEELRRVRRELEEARRETGTSRS